MYSTSDPPAIIDIEASGFGPDGYPIEIGVALSSGQTGSSPLKTIGPMPRGH